MHLYSNRLSAIATISSLVMSEIFSTCFSCSRKFNLSQSPLELEDKNHVFDSFKIWVFGFEGNFFSRDPAMIAVD